MEKNIRFSDLVSRGKAEVLASERRVLAEKSTRVVCGVDRIRTTISLRKRLQPSQKCRAEARAEAPLAVVATSIDREGQRLKKRVQKRMLQHVAPVLSNECIMQGPARAVLPRGFPGNRVHCDIRNAKLGGTGKETVDFWKEDRKEVLEPVVEFDQPKPADSMDSIEERFLEHAFQDGVSMRRHYSTW